MLGLWAGPVSKGVREGLAGDGGQDIGVRKNIRNDTLQVLEYC
jgi:hypothetical protein